jgi:outer membrane lipoprotein-sorting protein
MMYQKTIVTLLVFIGVATASAQMTALEYLQNAEEVMRGSELRAEMTMTIVRPTWEREMSLTSWAMGQDRAMMVITAPARDAGTVFLKRDREVWNWVPQLERVIKMPPSMMAQSWMGTDFSNDDLVRESSVIRDYTPTLIGSEAVMGSSCVIVELIPLPDAPVVWGKVLMWIDEVNFLQLKVESYDEFGDLVQTLEVLEIGEMGGRNLPISVQVVPSDEPGHRTIMRYNALDFSPGLEELFFTISQMQDL